jgi:serine protease inhibitor
MKYDDRLITSSEFKKKIDKINKRINEKTKGKIKSIIMTAEKEKPTQTNKYKWQVVI